MFTPTAPTTSKLLLIVSVIVFVFIVCTSLFILSLLFNLVIKHLNKIRLVFHLSKSNNYKGSRFTKSNLFLLG